VMLMLWSLAYYYGPIVHTANSSRNGFRIPGPLPPTPWPLDNGFSVKIGWEGTRSESHPSAFTWMWRGIVFQLAHQLKLLPISS